MLTTFVVVALTSVCCACGTVCLTPIHLQQQQRQRLRLIDLKDRWMNQWMNCFKSIKVVDLDSDVNPPLLYSAPLLPSSPRTHKVKNNNRINRFVFLSVAFNRLRDYITTRSNIEGPPHETKAERDHPCVRVCWWRSFVVVIVVVVVALVFLLVVVVSRARSITARLAPSRRVLPTADCYFLKFESGAAAAASARPASRRFVHSDIP